jgi:hypothetical protein
MSNNNSRPTDDIPPPAVEVATDPDVPPVSEEDVLSVLADYLIAVSEQCKEGGSHLRVTRIWTDYSADEGVVFRSLLDQVVKPFVTPERQVRLEAAVRAEVVRIKKQRPYLARLRKRWAKMDAELRQGEKNMRHPALRVHYDLFVKLLDEKRRDRDCVQRQVAELDARVNGVPLDQRVEAAMAFLRESRWNRSDHFIGRAQLGRLVRLCISEVDLRFDTISPGLLKSLMVKVKAVSA